MATAVIFIPHAAHLAQYGAACLDYCAARGYEVAGVVTGSWSAATAVLFARQAGILVVARPDHLPPDREPRVEVALPEAIGVTPHTSALAPPRLRRPRQV